MKCILGYFYNTITVNISHVKFIFVFVHKKIINMLTLEHYNSISSQVPKYINFFLNTSS